VTLPDPTAVRRRGWTLLAAAAMLVGAGEDTRHYHVDAAASSVTARVAFFGLASKTALFPAISGKVAIVPSRPESLSLDIALDARQLTAGDSITLSRLKGPKFFDVDHFPEVSFSARRMVLEGTDRARIYGTITARGITRPAVLAARFATPIADVRPGEPLSLAATTTIDRREFGMTAWRLIVGRDVRIAISARLLPD
jgi:polyisoprenoid-binding protein YceI